MNWMVIVKSIVILGIIAYIVMILIPMLKNKIVKAKKAVKEIKEA